MEHNEMVQKLHEKASIPTSVAQDALERANWDMLDALMILEREGKIEPLTASMTTVENPSAYEEVTATASSATGKGGSRKERFSEQRENLFDKAAELIKKSISHAFVVERKGQEILALPVCILILIGICMFQVAVTAMIVGLFCDCKYSIEDRTDKKNAPSETNEADGADGKDGKDGKDGQE